MKVSFGITTHNESQYVGRLLSTLATFIEDNQTGDEIVIVDDFSVHPTKEILRSYLDLHPNTISLYMRHLNSDFAAQKNYLTQLCKGDYVFQIDADEIIPDSLLHNLHGVLEANPTTDLFWIPRINTVSGLTPDHIRKWGWTVNDKKWVCFPDYQSRIYRRDPKIHWEGKVHERIVGMNTFTHLPAEESWCLIHEKDIKRQEQQNEKYASIQRIGYA